MLALHGNLLSFSWISKAQRGPEDADFDIFLLLLVLEQRNKWKRISA